MSHNHGHGSAGARHAGRLWIAFALTGSFMLVEAIAGVLTGSLVLVADAGHMLTDVIGIGFAILAIRFASRPATQRKTYGYYRVEILAALLNAVLLLGVAVYIVYEAAVRLFDPPAVESTPMLVVAIAGLAVNLFSAGVLMAGAKESLNVRGAFLEVVGDLLGSVGAIVAAVILITTGWRYADPLLAAFVAVLIVPRALMLLKETLDVLLESTPKHLDFEAVVQAMLDDPEVDSVHDLHIWTVTSGFVALSGHVNVSAGTAESSVLVRLYHLLHERFDIDHVTLQVETPQLADALGQPCLPHAANCFSGLAAPLAPSTRSLAP